MTFCPYQGSAKNISLAGKWNVIIQEVRGKLLTIEKLTQSPNIQDLFKTVHHPQQIRSKSNITLADGVAEGKKIFLNLQNNCSLNLQKQSSNLTILCLSSTSHGSLTDISSQEMGTSRKTTLFTWQNKSNILSGRTQNYQFQTRWILGNT